MRGKKSILNDKIIKDVAYYISIGCSNKDASALSGISEMAFYSWLRMADKNKSDKHVKFASEVKKAQAEYRRFHLNIIRKSAEDISITRMRETTITREKGKPGFTEKKVERITEHPPDPASSKWLLERKFPDEFGRPSRIHHEGQIDNPSAARLPNTINLIFDDGEGQKEK